MPFSRAGSRYIKQDDRGRKASSRRVIGDVQGHDVDLYFPTFARRDKSTSQNGCGNIRHSSHIDATSGDEMWHLEEINDELGNMNLGFGLASKSNDEIPPSAFRATSHSQAADLALIWDEDDEDDEESSSSEEANVKDHCSHSPTSSKASPLLSRTSSDSSSCFSPTMMPSLPFARRPSNSVCSPPNSYFAARARKGRTSSSNQSGSMIVSPQSASQSINKVGLGSSPSAPISRSASHRRQPHSRSTSIDNLSHLGEPSSAPLGADERDRNGKAVERRRNLSINSTLSVQPHSNMSRRPSPVERIHNSQETIKGTSSSYISPNTELNEGKISSKDIPASITGRKRSSTGPPALGTSRKDQGVAIPDHAEGIQSAKPPSRFSSSQCVPSRSSSPSSTGPTPTPVMSALSVSRPSHASVDVVSVTRQESKPSKDWYLEMYQPQASNSKRVEERSHHRQHHSLGSLVTMHPALSNALDIVPDNAAKDCDRQS